MDSEVTPLKHVVAPGEYSVQWFLPTENGETQAVEGMIELLPERPPRGQMFDGAPIKWDVGEDHSHGASFPQTYEYPMLEGRLRNNYSIFLIDAEVLTWFGDRANVTARCALVGWAPDAGQPTTFHSIRLQTTFLDRLSAVAPLSKFKIPFNTDGKPIEWWAQQSSDLTQTWESGGNKLRLSFDCRARTGDPYEMVIRYSPVVTVDLAEAASIDEVVQEWVQPLKGISTVAMGEASSVTFLSVAPQPKSEDGVKGQRFLQLYGSGLAQEPYASKRWNGRDPRPALTFKSDGISLLNLIGGWTAHTKGSHPLYETYVSVLGVQDDHPRSRLLLLLQAIEGHYGHENREKLAANATKFSETRAVHMETVMQVEDLPGPTKKFIEKNLARSPFRGLDGALHWANKSLPVDISDRLEACTLISDVVTYDDKIASWADALRVVRNNLAHGNKTYETTHLYQVTSILDLVVRAHVLRTLGADDDTLINVLNPKD